MRNGGWAIVCVWAIVAAGLGTPPALADNHPPVVSNVTSSQRLDASKLVDIYYNLADADGDPCTVSVLASDDAGATWDVPITAVSGAVGPGITPGSGKHIVWNCPVDLPGEFGDQYKVRVCADDGHSSAPPGMVLIPAGEFQMGDTFNEGWLAERPVHAVYVDAFYMDSCKVTNQQYAAGLNWAWAQGGLITVTSGVVYKYGTGTSYPYCDTTTSSSYSRITWNGSTFGVVAGKESHPMVMVSWYGSVAYANWRSGMQGKPLCYDLSTWTCNFGSGYRLPTEAEWEKAARGGAAGHRFPWSDTDTIQHARANYYSDSEYPYDTSPTRGCHPTFNTTGVMPYTSPVGYFAANGYGLYDMAGNVWEWCNDWFGETYYSSSPYDNPHGPAIGTYRVLRGGSWDHFAIHCRCAARGDGGGRGPRRRAFDHGFRLALDSPSLRDTGCADSAAFTIDNRGGGNVTVYQRGQGIFLSDVPFQNTFKAVVSDWGGGSPGTVTFSLNGQVVTLPYVSGGVETSAFDMSDLPGGECAQTSILTVTAKNSGGTTVGQTSVALKCINRPWFMPGPPFVQVKSLSPFQWGQEIVYEVCIGLPPVCLDSLQNLDATWYGENALFKNYGGLISGGELNIEFNGAKGEYTFEIKADLSPTEDKPKLGKLLKPTTHKQKMDWKGEGTLGATFSATATISPATGCFAGGPEVCASFQGGYEWKLIPIGPLFPPIPIFFTGKAGFDIGPELCFEPFEFSLDNPVPLTAVNVNFNLTGQGGLELGIPYFLSVFGGLEGNAAGKIHVLGDPVPTCWDWPMLADLDFDLSIVGYARLGFSEWELGRFVIVQWSCPQGKGFVLVPVSGESPAMRKAGRPYLENGEPYAQYQAGVRQGGDVKRDGSRGEADELITANTNLEATPATAGWGNLTLVVTSEDDPETPEYVEHEIYAIFRDGPVWGEKVAITDNTDSDVQPAAAFDGSGTPIVAWVTLPGTTGEETLEEMKAKMEIGYSVYDSGLDEWSASVQLTSNTGLDAMPQLVRGTDGSTNLIWLHSADNSLPVGPGEPPGVPPSVMVARWNGTVFGTPEVLLAACDSIGAIRYARDAGGREYLLWTWDADGDPNTVSDREVVESHTVGGVWTDPAALTPNAIADTAVGLLATPGGVIAYFVRVGGTEEQLQDLLIGRLFDGSAWSNEAALISAMTTILSPSFSMGPDGSVSCAWVGPGFDEYGKAVLYASSPDGWADWSEPQEMAVGSLPTAPACTYAGGNIQVCYVSARPARGADRIEFGLKGARSTAFDVRLLDHTPYTDLWVEAAGIEVSPQPPVGAEAATISVTVHLSGDFDQSGVEVEVFDGDSSQGGLLIASDVADLIPGGEVVLEFPWTYPSDFEEHEIHVVVDPNDLLEELNEGNNGAHVAIGGLNLRAVSVHPVFWTGEHIGVRVTIENGSYASLADVAFELRRDSETGPLILSDTVPSVPPGEQVEMVVPWDITLTDAGVYELFLIVDPFGAVQEQEESDNSISGQIRVLPDLQAEQWSAAIVGATAQITVRNVGAKAMAATTVRVIQADQVLGEAAVPALDAGTSADETIPLSGPVHPGTVTIKVNPDSTGEDEVTLLNNEAIVTVYSNADLDRDGDVDLDDFAIFATCMAGPDVTAPPPGATVEQFARGDLDGDLDVDLADFALFQAAMTGSPRT